MGFSVTRPCRRAVWSPRREAVQACALSWTHKEKMSTTNSNRALMKSADCKICSWLEASGYRIWAVRVCGNTGAGVRASGEWQESSGTIAMKMQPRITHYIQDDNLLLEAKPEDSAVTRKRIIRRDRRGSCLRFRRGRPWCRP